MNVRRPLNQISTRRRRNPGHRSATARANDHPTSFKRTAGDGRHEIFVVVILGNAIARVIRQQLVYRKVLQIDIQPKFVQANNSRRITDCQVNICAGIHQDFHQSLAVSHAAGAGDRDHDGGVFLRGHVHEICRLN